VGGNRIETSAGSADRTPLLLAATALPPGV